MGKGKECNKRGKKSSKFILLKKNKLGLSPLKTSKNFLLTFA